MGPVAVGAGGRRALRMLLLTECLVLGLLGLAAAEAHAVTPSSLAGETLTSDNVRGSTLTGSCNVPTKAGTFSFSVSGTAAGPFPGTFTESGSFTTEDGGFVSRFSSSFAITSTSGTVTGSKDLVVGADSKAPCSHFLNGIRVSTDFPIETTYTATINGAQPDTGGATVDIAGQLGSPPTFSESFGSSGVVPLTSKEQCKDGGWQSFGFENQGGCVSFVATGGKNPPGGS
jgi:hypothetical protein